MTTIPKPIYVDLDTLQVDGSVVSGDVCFPLTDATIADREDHVNTAHMLLAVWNIAHWYNQHIETNLRGIRVTGQHFSGFQTMTPDTTYQLQVAVAGPFTFNRVWGSINAWFLKDDDVLATIGATWTAQK